MLGGLVCDELSLRSSMVDGISFTIVFPLLQCFLDYNTLCTVFMHYSNSETCV